MFSKQYQEYLRSAAWQKKRQACFAYHGKRCKACYRTSGPIQVHHMDYATLYREDPVRDLIPLCLDCHRSVTKVYRSNRRRGLRRVTIEYVKTKRRLVEARRMAIQADNKE